MQSTRTLLTLAIPTYNRSAFLSELLESILPQVLSETRVEVLISDNCSTDDTPAIVESFNRRGLGSRYLRNPVNLGADANFLQCFRQSAGDYFWVVGDDDVLVSDAIGRLLDLLRPPGKSPEDARDFDLIYLSSFPLLGRVGTDRISSKLDPLGRFAEVITDGRYFLDRVHGLITLISAVIVNKKSLTANGKPSIRDLGPCSLQQLAWVLPSVRRNSRILYIWERLVGYRSFNSGGWAPCQVFGVDLPKIASEYYEEEPDLVSCLRNALVSTWLPAAAIEVRKGNHPGLIAEDWVRILGPVYSRNWRYWVFLYPIVSLPLGLTNVAFGITNTMNKASRALSVLAKHFGRRGESLPRA